MTFKNIYILPSYANPKHLSDNRYETSHESVIRFNDKGIQIDLTETNSLIEDKYSLNLSSARFEVEGNVTERKEAMIHHHPQGHRFRHLQFKLKARNEVIRIKLDMLDDKDYFRCIKGFLSITQRILQLEKEENKIDENLIEFFFNDEIKKLESDKIFLLTKIEQSYSDGGMLDDNNQEITNDKLEMLKKETHLLPFLEWD